jgi:hypothetical protein
MTRDELNQIRDELNERLSQYQAAAEETHQLAPNSYGAGYDRGFVDALTEAICKLA